MTDQPSTSAITPQGRFIRAALIIFPVGTAILGAGSFGIWWWKKQRVEERGFEYASALRRDLNAADLTRYVTILSDVFAQPPEQRLPAVASFLESSMGAENMGYNVRRDDFETNGLTVANVDVELTGKKRPREVVLLVAPYGDAAKATEEAHALATMMALAHAMTAENRQLTLRFAGIPIGVRDGNGKSGFERFAAECSKREERLMKVIVLGGPSEAELQDVRTAFRADRTGTIVEGLPATRDVSTTLAAASALRPVLAAAVQR